LGAVTPVASAPTMNCLNTCLAQLRNEARSFISMSRSAFARRAGSKAPDLSWKPGFEVMTWRKALVGNAEAELAPLLVDRRLVHQLLQDAAIEADWRASSLGEWALEPALILLDRSIVGDVIVLGRDFSRFRPTRPWTGLKPRSMSPTPQMTKLTMMSPMDDRHDRLADESLRRVAYRFEAFSPYSPFVRGARSAPF